MVLEDWRRDESGYYPSRVGASIYNESALDGAVDELLFVNSIALFGLYGIFVRGHGWCWRPSQRINRLKVEVEWI